MDPRRSDIRRQGSTRNGESALPQRGEHLFEGGADKWETTVLVKAVAHLANGSPNRGAIGGRATRPPPWCESGAEGEDEMGNGTATWMAPISEIGLIKANRSVGTTFPRLRRVARPGESSNGEGEDDFLSGRPPRIRIRGFGASGCYLIAGGRRAITRDANNSHVCYAFHVGKGKGRAHTNIKCIYIGGNNVYLWWTKDLVSPLSSVGGGPDVAENLIPVW